MTLIIIPRNEESELIQIKMENNFSGKDLMNSGFPEKINIKLSKMKRK